VAADMASVKAAVIAKAIGKKCVAVHGGWMVLWSLTQSDGMHIAHNATKTKSQKIPHQF
jgi:hypothetical protein